MSSITLTPAASGTTTLTGTITPPLTTTGIEHVQENQHAKIPGDNVGDISPLAPLDASLLTTCPITNPRTVHDLDSPETLPQDTGTDHMITARWTSKRGWEAPRLVPFGALSIMPTASVLHYATECFEGLKLYRGFDNRLRLFRVTRNCERMRRSAARAALPDFDAKELEKMIVALCSRDAAKWLPKDRKKGGFLYVRPTLIGTDAALGLRIPKEAFLYVMLVCLPDPWTALAAPFASPASKGNSETRPKVEGLTLMASGEDTIRAWPGGFGYAKVGANYGPSLTAHGEAVAKGFHQVLWLLGQEKYVTEAGASNFFVVIRSKPTGKLKLITAPLHDRIILDGVTRASVLQLAKERLGSGNGALENVVVEEERFTMDDLLEASHEERFVEAFATGTAFFIAPVQCIHFRGREIKIPMGPDGLAGAYARQIREWLVDIMYGRESHEWGVVVEEVV